MNTPQEPPLGSNIENLLAELKTHIAHMPTHQRERQQGDLLIRATTELRRLKTAVDETLQTNGHLADGHQCTLLGLKVALGFQVKKICRACQGFGQVEIQSGPYYRVCNHCDGTGVLTSTH